MMMIHFVGAGPGAPDLITVRGMNLLRGAGMVVYTGSLVAPELLDYAPSGCELHNSASMTLDEVTGTMKDGFGRGLNVVRLHTGDPSLYGAVREQMDRLKELGIPFEMVPGVSSLGAAAAALNAEYTLPGVSQTLIVARMEGRTPVPERERVRDLASHGASMAFFLSAGMLGKLCRELIEGGYEPDTPAALVYKASWPEQKILRAALSDLSARAKEAGMPRKTALVLVGKFLGDGSLGGAYEVSRLYDASFEHEFRGACSIEACSIEANSHEACSLEACSHETSLPKIKAVVAAFTRAGALLGLRIAGALGGRVFAPERYAGGGVESLTGTVFDWAGEWFSKSDALIFVSAAGIAVRAVASHVKDKTTDPAVVALDDAGENVISLLSGHVGGGNELARKIAAVTGGRAIVTTATDTHGIQSADEWAARNDCAIENAAAVKQISAATLDMASIGIAVTDESVAPPWPVTLWLRPRVLVLGVGCGRGVAKADLDAAAEDFLRGAGRSPLALKAVASIDLKRDEPAILDFCRERGIPFVTYGAEELRSVRGSFSSSQRVLEATGVDNVCERAAVLAAGSGILLRSKTRYPRISLALARLVGKIP